MRDGAEVRYLAETAVFARSYHLGSAWASLDQVFVPPRFLAPTTEIEPDHLPDWGPEQLNTIWPDLASRVATPHMAEMDLQQLLRSGRRVIISAESGAGKTTLLAYAAQQCAQAEVGGKFDYLVSTLPALAHVAELVLDAETTDPMTPLTVALQKRLNPLNRAGITALLKQKARSGRLLLLLDGWSELTVANRDGVVHWLRRLLKTYPDSRIIMSASLTGFGPLMSLGFTRTILRPWRPYEVEPFAAKWAQVLTNNPLPIDRFWLPGHNALETSLRFWLIGMGHETSTARSPQRLYQLVERCLCTLFADGLDEQWHETAVVFWELLAYTMLTTDALRLAPEDVDRLGHEAAAGDESIKRGLVDSLTVSALFVVDSGGHARFLSRVWRDFLAARYLVKHECANDVRDHLRDSRWQGTLRFYIAQMGAGELATELLREKVTSPMRDSLFQVASWLAEAPDGGPWRRQTLILLGQLARQRTFAQALRLRAAAALVQTEEVGTLTFVRQLLERSDPFLRQAGVVALSNLGLFEPAQTVDQLQAMLEDGDGSVRETAVSALAWLASPLAEKPLLTALIEGDDGMRRAAAQGLALNGTEGVEILKEALEDEAPAVRRAAVQGLTLLSDAWVSERLQDVERRDPEWIVRNAAAEALETMRLRAKDAAWQPSMLKEQRWLVTYAAKKSRVLPEGEAALPFLVQMLAELPEAKLRAAAAVTLGQFVDQRAIPALETAVRDIEPQVQEAAFVTLSLINRAFAD